MVIHAPESFQAVLNFLLLLTAALIKRFHAGKGTVNLSTGSVRKRVKLPQNVEVGRSGSPLGPRPPQKMVTEQPMHEIRGLGTSLAALGL